MSEQQYSLTRLSIEGVRLYARHGVLREERLLGGQYEIDLDLFYDARAAIREDNLSKAVDYCQVLHLLTDVMDRTQSLLIERVAHDILNAVITGFPAVQRATVRLRKLTLPVAQILSHVQIEQTRVREGMP